MKIGKKSTAVLAFTIGAVVFAISAMADIAIGSGYHNLKDSAKETMARLTNDVDSFTADLKLVMKLDGKDIEHESATRKFDIKGKRKEDVNTSLNPDGTTQTYYSYYDGEMSVYKNESDEKYHVYKGANDDSFLVLENPFEEKIAQDAETVVDAFVGSLKDVIQMEEADGKKMYIGNLTETQVPTLVNALTSFVVKYSVLDDRYLMEKMGLPKITDDLCVYSASGKAIENEDGLLEDMLGTVTLTGLDEDGNSHVFTAEISISIYDVNQTEIVLPELTDKNAEITTSGRYRGLSEKYVGVYKNDIVIVEDDLFRKVGERVFEITAAGEDMLEGRYYETYVEGYIPKEPIEAFTFTKADDPLIKNYATNIVSYTDAEGKRLYAVIHNSGSVGQNLNVELNVEFSEDDTGYSSVGTGGFFIREYE